MTAMPAQNAVDLAKVEDRLEVYILMVFFEKGEHYRQYFQRSIAITTLSKAQFDAKVEPMHQKLQKMRPDVDVERTITSRSEMIKEKHKTPDTAFVLFENDLEIVKISPETGHVFYEDKFEICPESGRKLRPVIMPRDGSF